MFNLFLSFCACLLMFPSIAQHTMVSASNGDSCPSFEIHDSCSKVDEPLEVTYGKDLELFGGLCNFTVISNETSGTIASPNYPKAYHSNACYSWHITVPEGMVISIAFNDTFNVVNNSHGSCDHDSLALDNDIYRRHCGDTPPKNFVTRSNSLTADFITNDDVENVGFSFAWCAVVPWGLWSECSATCGDSHRIRRRRLDADDRSNPSPRSKCLNSTNVDVVQREECNKPSCDWLEESVSNCLLHDPRLLHKSCYDDLLCVQRNRRVYGIGRKDLAECVCRNLDDHDLRLETARCINLTFVNVKDNKTITIPGNWSLDPIKSAGDSTKRHTPNDTPNGTPIKKSAVSYILLLYMVAVLVCP